MIMDQRRTDADARGDILQRDAVIAVFGEQLFGGIEDALDRGFADACLVVAGARAFGDRRLLWRGRIGGAHGVSGCRVAAGASTPPSGIAAGKAEKPISSRHPRPSRRRAATSASRSEEHTSELQSLMRHSYAVFCLKKKKNNKTT